MHPSRKNRDKTTPPGAHSAGLFSPLLERWLAVSAIVLAGLLCYANTTANPFIFDDYDAIVDNPRIRPLSLTTILGADPVNTPISGRPVVALTFALNHALHGLDVRGYHLFNTLIHILASLALFGLCRRTLLLPRFSPRYSRHATRYALAVALLWAVHPLQTAAVTYIVSRTESLMGLFFLLTLYCAARGFQASRPEGWYAAAITCCALGMASKEVMVSAPLLVFVYDFLFVQDRASGVIRQRKGFYAALACTWLVIVLNQLRLPHAAGISFNLPGLGMLDYLLTQVTVIVHYLRLALWPYPLVLDSQDWPLADVFSLGFAAQFALLASLLIASITGFLRRKWWSLPGLSFFAILSPTSSIIPLLGEIVDERRMYLPLAAVLVVLVFCGDHLLGKTGDHFRWPVQRQNLLRVFILAVLLALLGAMTFTRNQDYRSGMSIWQDTVAKRPANPRAREGLGKELMRAGMYAEAAAQFQSALRLYPPGQSVEDLAEIYSALGASLAETGNFAEAIRMHRRSIDLLPARALMPHRLGNTYLRAQDLHNAALAFQQALTLDPTYYPAHGNLALTLMQLGDFAGAEQHLQALLRLSPDQGAALSMLAELRLAQGRPAEARELQQRAMTLEAAGQ